MVERRSLESASYSEPHIPARKLSITGIIASYLTLR